MYANTAVRDGGWYVVGAVTNEHNVAVDVPGYARALCPDPIARVRDVVRTHVDPVPLFFPQVIELDGDRLALAVYVPDGQATPFITRGGRIHRRTQDASDPIAENDRHALDQLVERGRKGARRFAAFAHDMRTFSRAEEHQAWANLYISPEPFGAVFHLGIVSRDDLGALLARTRDPVRIPCGDLQITSCIPFTAAQPTAGSVVLRRVMNHRQAFNALTVEFDQFGRAKLLIPLSAPVGDEAWVGAEPRSTAVRAALTEHVTAGESWYHLKRLDIGQLWLAVAGLVSLYREWLGPQPLVVGYQVAIELTGVWRFVPFVDSDEWAEAIRSTGLPVMPTDEIRFPEESEHAYHFGLDGELWMDACRELALALGLTPDTFSELIGRVFIAAANVQRP